MKLEEGQRVEIYRNLNRKGITFSVRDRRTGLVIHRIDVKNPDSQLILRNAVFHVSQAGRKRVLKEQRKNVHALIRANISLYEGTLLAPHGARPLYVGYDPYATDHFIGCVDKKGGGAYRLDVAEWVTIDSRGVIAWIGENTFQTMEKK